MVFTGCLKCVLSFLIPLGNLLYLWYFTTTPRVGFAYETGVSRLAFAKNGSHFGSSSQTLGAGVVMLGTPVLQPRAKAG